MFNMVRYSTALIFILSCQTALADWEQTSKAYFQKKLAIFNNNNISQFSCDAVMTMQDPEGYRLNANPKVSLENDASQFACNYIDFLRHSPNVSSKVIKNMIIINNNSLKYSWHFFTDSDSIDIEKMQAEFKEPDTNYPCLANLEPFSSTQSTRRFAYIRSKNGIALEATSCFVYEDMTIELDIEGNIYELHDLEVESFNKFELIDKTLSGEAFIANW
tara:strand:+ start:273 stop:926 length:654 start_codon:yes stop_codon:yes gene_type:complete